MKPTEYIFVLRITNVRELFLSGKTKLGFYFYDDMKWFPTVRDKCCTMFYIFLLGHFYKPWYDINLPPAFCTLEVFSVNRNCHQLTVAAMGT